MAVIAVLLVLYGQAIAYFAWTQEPPSWGAGALFTALGSAPLALVLLAMRGSRPAWWALMGIGVVWMLIHWVRAAAGGFFPAWILLPLVWELCLLMASERDKRWRSRVSSDIGRQGIDASGR